MKTDDLNHVRSTLWKAADELRANSTLAPNEYRGPVLGLIFRQQERQRPWGPTPSIERGRTMPASSRQQR